MSLSYVLGRFKWPDLQWLSWIEQHTELEQTRRLVSRRTGGAGKSGYL